MQQIGSPARQPAAARRPGGSLACALLLAAVACSKAPPAPSNTAPTPETHTGFPIATGLHAVSCGSCHLETSASFKDYTCTGCHLNDRVPHDQSSTNGVHTALSKAQGVYSYDSKACVTCHLADPVLAGYLEAGTKGPYSHTGVTNNCTLCHAAGAAFAALPSATSKFDHTSVGSTDCVACHLLPAGRAPVATDWNGGVALPSGVLFDERASVTVAVQTPGWSGASITTLVAGTQTLPMPMVHCSAGGAVRCDSGLDAAALSRCSACHLNLTSGGFYPGTYHASVAQQPASCNGCHAAAITGSGSNGGATSVPTGFVGPPGTTPPRTPPSSEMRHDAALWDKETRKSGVPLVTQECAACHLTPAPGGTKQWSVGRGAAGAVKFHASLGAAQPASCIDCHANNRPKQLTQANAAGLPPGLIYDHQIAPSLSDCIACHAGASAVTSWAGGRYHLSASAAQGTCLPCHSGERPSATINATGTWKSTTYTAAPFDYLTNPQGIPHGNGNDCASCHGGPGTGGTQSWQAGHFSHSPSSDAGATCIACHDSQRPGAPVPYTNPQGQPDSFDHSQNGTGECFGCHQASVKAITVDKGLTLADWKGGQGYPGASLVGSPTQFIKFTQLVLQRTSPSNPALITGVTTLPATLKNQFLHTSPAVPLEFGLGTTPDTSKCWHCHTHDGAGKVTSFSNGEYHSSIDTFTDTPGGPKKSPPLSQATNRCDDCHTLAPPNIVEKVVTANGTSTLSALQPMDHSALFAAAVSIGGVSASGVPAVDCSACHLAPGLTWSDGLLHKNIAAAVPKDCAQCHYPLLHFDAALADQTSGTAYAMKHASGQVAFQACQTCHAGALAKGATTPALATLWSGGVFHPSLGAQPTACNDCHTLSLPASATQSSLTYALPLGATSSNGAQWMSHQSPTLTGKDCFLCHAQDAKTSGSAWNKDDSFHAPVPTAASCQECHGVTNGNGAEVGSKNNLPQGLTDSSTVSTAGVDSTTGVPAGTKNQLSHAQLNVRSRDCNFCHTQAGASTSAAVKGREWALAKFHASFTGANPPVFNGTTARCTDCHLNVKPTTAFTKRDHSGFTGTSAQDCSACHTAPPARSDWLGASETPQFLTVGGFTVPQPPAPAGGTLQGGLTNLPHPADTSCTSCHAGGAGAKQAFGYDHASAVINTKVNGCNSCHEAGSDLVGTVWNNSVTTAPPPPSNSSAGDTRPITLGRFTFSFSGNSCTVTPSDTTNFPGAQSHFYPTDCYACHAAPAGIAVATTGTTYLAPNNNQASAGMWKFVHNETKMANACDQCHLNNGLGAGPKGCRKG